MKQKPIKYCDELNFERFNRDAEKVKVAILLLQFLNFITFKIFQDRLLYQLDIIMNAWNKSIQEKEYFDKK